jgi:hypothetical protein
MGPIPWLYFTIVELLPFQQQTVEELIKFEILISTFYFLIQKFSAVNGYTK